MKICIYSQSPKVGGGVTVKTVLLIEYLLSLGHRVTWVFPRNTGNLPGYISGLFENKNLTIIEKRRIRYLRVLDSIDLYNEIPDDFDIYQVVSGYCSDGINFYLKRKKYFLWVATTIRREKGVLQIRKIRSIRDIIAWVNNKIGLWLEAICARAANRVFVASARTISELQSDYSIDKAKCEIVHPLINTFKYRPKEVSQDVPKFLLVMGIISKRKNIPLVLEAFEIIQKAYPDLELLIVGKTNGYEAKLASLCRKLGLLKVKFVGEVPSNVELYQDALCTISTSYEEGFGMVLAESLSCGTPVISTRSGGSSDIVIHNWNGFLIDYDKYELADRVAYLIENPIDRKRMSDNGQRYVTDNFSVKIGAEKILMAYER